MSDFKVGDKVWCAEKPAGNSVNNYEVGKLYTLKQKSFSPSGKFQGWITEENSFWVLKESLMEIYEEAGGQ